MFGIPRLRVVGRACHCCCCLSGAGNHDLSLVGMRGEGSFWVGIQSVPFRMAQE